MEPRESSCSQKTIYNPENEESRCRICYEEHKPLINLCECSGSIGYVHEGCILDWITKKLETAEELSIPRCEICHVRYFARIKVGGRKVCFKTFLLGFAELGFEKVFASCFYLISALMALYLLIRFCYDILSLCVFEDNFTSQQLPDSTEVGQLLSVVFDNLFRRVVFPGFFLKEAYRHAQKRSLLVKDCFVQVVELTLLPKRALKETGERLIMH